MNSNPNPLLQKDRKTERLTDRKTERKRKRRKKSFEGEKSQLASIDLLLVGNVTMAFKSLF